MRTRRRERLAAVITGTLALGWLVAVWWSANAPPARVVFPIKPAGAIKRLTETERLLSAGDRAGARKALQKALASDPNASELVTAARLYARAGDPGAARGALASLVRAESRSPVPDDLEAAAEVYLDLGSAANAAAALEPLTTRRDASARLWITLGRARQALGQGPRGLEALRRAEALAPDDAEKRSLAIAYQDAGDYSDSDRLLDALSRKNPNDAGLLGDRGVLAALSGRPAQAADYLRRAIQLSPSQAGPYLTLASVYAQQKRSQEALQVLDAALARSDLGPLRADVVKARRNLLKKRS